jgi:ornithine carbamoyltransferase
LESLLDLSDEVKRGTKLSVGGKTLAMIFQKPSTRTRVSFEVVMRQLGGHALYLSWNELQLGRGEAIADTARTLSRYVDGIVARVLQHSDLEEFSRYASIPVINGLSNLHHPCQAMSDLFTIREKKGRLEGLKLAWVGDGTNVCNSLLIGSAIIGMSMDVACPEGFEPNSDVLRWAEEQATGTSEVRIVREPEEAVDGADVVYTDTFVSMGAEAEREERLRVFLPKYQVTSELLELAKPDAIFMHCLPARRGEEVVDEVIDGPRSVVWDQTENRLHVQKALLASIL